MKRFTLPGVLVTVAILAGACSDSTAPMERLEPAAPDLITLIAQYTGTCPTTGTDGWTKIDAASGSASGAWGSYSYLNNSTEFTYLVNAGYTLQFCIKAATQAYIYEVVGYETGTQYIGMNAISHTGWRIMEEPTGELVGLTVSKGAEASYDRTVEWELVKKVRLASSDFGTGVDLLQLSGSPGQSFDIIWDVIATKDEEVDNFKVWGVITITNPNPVSVYVDVTDVLDDLTVAEVDCDPLTEGAQAFGTVPANDYLECTYEAYPEDDSATENEAEVVVDQDSYTLPPGYTGEIVGDVAYADVEFIENLIGDDEVLLEDERTEYSETISESTTEHFPETFTCSENIEDYVDGVYCDTFENVATLTGDYTDLEDNAVVELTCTGLYGCTPGFWKVPVHWGHWLPTGYLPTTLVGSVFFPSNFGGSTLVQALDFGGGPGVNGAQMILLRAAVASLLNFAHPDVNFGIPDLPGITDAAGLIDAVNAALTSNNRGTMLALATILDDANNAVNLCALSGQSFLD